MPGDGEAKLRARPIWHHKTMTTPANAPAYLIRRYIGSIEVWPDTAEIRNFLTLVWRKMENEGRGLRGYKHIRSAMYKPTTGTNGQASLRSFQGFWQSLAEFLRKRKRLVSVVDEREDFPRPNIAAAMFGLREYQKQPLVEFLLACDSGMKGAPTRWGKTWDIAGMIKAYVGHPGMRIVVAAPGVDLCQQLQADLRAILPPSIDVRGIYTGSKGKDQSPHVTVCCSKSLHKCDAEATRLLILDETHAWASDDNAAALTRFSRARIFSLGATLCGRSDRRDRILTGLVGPVWSNVTYLQAVAVKAISPCTVIMLRCLLDYDDTEKTSDRLSAYNRALYRSPKMAATVKRILTEAVPKDWQTMAFIADEKQADFYMKEALNKIGVVAMAKKLSPKARKTLTARIAAAFHKWVIASIIYIQGVTFPDLRVLLNLAGGGSNTGTIQRPGRLLQMRPGKLYGVMVDMLFQEGPGCPVDGPWKALKYESQARLDTYLKIGYDVLVVDTVDEIREIILKSHGTIETPGEADQPVPEPERRSKKAPRTVTPRE